MPSTADDLALIARQEQTLHLLNFDADTAWQLGSLLHELAVTRHHSLVIDIRRFGTPDQQLFFAATPGTTPDNSRWVQRKINAVARLHRSSYALGLALAESGRSFSDRYNLPEADYATHGGCFPLHVTGAGILGAVTISGLPQRDDHNLAVEALCLLLHLDPATLLLPPL